MLFLGMPSRVENCAVVKAATQDGEAIDLCVNGTTALGDVLARVGATATLLGATVLVGLVVEKHRNPSNVPEREGALVELVAAVAAIIGTLLVVYV
ncbi:hypothetical protein B8281_15995 [Cellulosimicrobium sp. TH-20]|nr:hypothetical protein B8281_15995 [Cellulosimicrobium sp. TH-20]